MLYPPAPDLTKADVVSRWSDAELFWIIKHGIKDTGMLAVGPTHKDEDVWAVSAFVRQLPEVTPEQYRATGAGVRGKEEGARAPRPSTTITISSND